MIQISDEIFADEAVMAMDFAKRPMAGPYERLPWLCIEGFFDAGACRALIAAADEASAIDAALRTKTGAEVKARIRDTRLHAMPEAAMRRYEAAFGRHRGAIERFFGVALAEASRPQLLEYGPGGHYLRHADDSSEIVDTAGKVVGYKKVAPQRVVTTVLFLNSRDADFTGGTLRFNHLRTADGEVAQIIPAAGTLLAFPSHPLFAHEVLPVEQGRRFAVAQWHNALL